MNFEQIASLIKEGYTQEQIIRINSILGAPAPADPKPETKPAANTDTGTDTNTKKPEEQTAPAETETQKMLKEMLGLMQKGFVNNLGTSGGKETDTAEQALIAAVLNP